MVQVNWDDATAYAKWAGKRLPTEAEWEYAVRGGLVGKRYPWGNELTHDDANYTGTGGKDKWDKCAPVGSFAANGYGLYDMAGNVTEWCADWHNSTYYSNSPLRNPTGAHSSDPGSPRYGARDTRVIRGGSFGSDAIFLSVAIRRGGRPGYGG